jgi:hypothetical protein
MRQISCTSSVFFEHPNTIVPPIESVEVISPSRSLAELLPIKSGWVIGRDAVETLNARDLHAFLEVGTAFDVWFARRVEEYGF